MPICCFRGCGWRAENSKQAVLPQHLQSGPCLLKCCCNFGGFCLEPMLDRIYRAGLRKEQNLFGHTQPRDFSPPAIILNFRSESNKRLCLERQVHHSCRMMAALSQCGLSWNIADVLALRLLCKPLEPVFGSIPAAASPPPSCSF